MNHKLLKKLRARSGETLAEVLVALLVIGMASLVLAVMVTTAGRMDSSVRQRDILFAEDLEKAEQKSEVRDDAGHITVKADGGSNSVTVTYDVTFYGGHGLTSYEEKGGVAP